MGNFINNSSGDSVENITTSSLWLKWKRMGHPAVVATVYPDKYVGPNDKVSNIVFNFFLDSRQQNSALYSAKTIPIKLGKSIFTGVCLDFDTLRAHGAFGEEQKISMYDRVVHDAIVTLYACGNEHMTVQMIYHIMTGNKNSRVNPQNKEEIKRSILKMLLTNIKFQVEDGTHYPKFAPEEFKYFGSLLQGEIIETTFTGGEVAECLHLVKPPILYAYAEKKGQIIRTDIGFLNTPLTKNKENLVLQKYL